MSDLRAALEPFKKLAEQFSPHAHDDSWTICERNGVRVELGDLRRARSALAGDGETVRAVEGTDVAKLAEALTAWAEPIESGYSVPAAGQVMRNAATVIRSLSALPSPMPVRGETTGEKSS